MKKIPGENSKRKPQVGDLVKFDITWCEGLDPLGNVYSHGTGETLMQYGVVTGIRPTPRPRYYIIWKGVSLMYFGGEKHIEIVG